MESQQRPHILITGAAGSLAQQVINRLRDTCNLVAVDFREQVYLGDDIPSYCIDFNKRSFEDLFRRYQFDGVIHLGRIMSSQMTRMRRYNANVLGTQKLLDLSHKFSLCFRLSLCQRTTQHSDKQQSEHAKNDLRIYENSCQLIRILNIEIFIKDHA